MRKIVIACGFEINKEALDLLREVAQVKVTRDDSEAALSAEAGDADAILVGPRPYVMRDLIESASRLKHIARVGVGLDSIDMQAAAERGIMVTNTPDVTADSVAEFTMSLLLSLAKNIPRCDRAVREGRWNERFELSHTNIELRGKTHGIVGLGRIGGRVAVRCKAFGMRILYNKRNRDLEFEKSAGVEFAPLDVLLKESDTISLHLPLTKETMNLFDKARFESMKRTALLINQARGKVVNEKALVQALKEGKLGGYATDVHEDEPPDPKNELLQLKNVIVSPHLGGGTRESMLRVSMVVAEDVVRVIRGEIPKNLVNREVLEEDLLTENSIAHRATTKAKEIKINARSIIIATGGYAGNKELLEKYCLSYTEAMRCMGLPHMGDGLRLATEIGAATEGLGLLHLSGPFFPGSLYLTSVAKEPDVILVNREGERFTDENLTNFERANTIDRQPGKICYALFDARIKQSLMEEGLKGFGHRIAGGTGKAL